MKKILYIALFLLLPITSLAQKQLKVYHHNGEVDRVSMPSTSAIFHSKLDKQGNEQDDFVSIEIDAEDGKHQYLIADIDSVVLPNGKRVVFRGVTAGQPVLAKASRAPRKTSFNGNFPGTQGNNNVTFKWTDNDRIRLDVGYLSRAENLSADMTSADFVFEGADDLEAESYTVYFPDKTVTIKTEQTQNGADNSEHIGPAGDCGTATANRDGEGNYSFTLDHQASYLCFLPHINNLPSARVSRIELYCNDAIAGTYQLSRTDLYDAANTSQAVSLNLIPQDDSKDFFLGHNTRTEQDTCASYMVIVPNTNRRYYTARYFVTDTLSRIEKVFDQHIWTSFATPPNTVIPITCNIPDDVFRSVDMGLSTNWASMNVGSKTPSQPGNSYTTDVEAEAALLEETAVTEWLMPTAAQRQELIDKCTWTWGMYNGATGYFVTGASPAAEDGKVHRIFLPAASQTSPAACLTANCRPVQALMIDLGLPSGTRWASRNVGAYNAVDYGEYFAWGETEKKSNYDSDNKATTLGYYKFSNTNLGTTKTFKNGNTYRDIAGTEHDVAHVKWGGLWTMPDYDDCQELADECTWTWTTLRGNNGYLVTGPNGNSIFLPATCHLNGWTRGHNYNVSQYNTSTHYDNTYAWTLNCHTGWESGKPFLYNNYYYNSNRYFGHTVRPVVKGTADSGNLLLKVVTDEAAWTFSDTQATLYGTLATASPLSETLTVGFVIGDSATIDFDHKRTYIETTTNTAGSFSGNIPVHDNLGYWYRAYVKVGNEYFYGDAQHYGLEMVDLGLPSGIKWANMNLGADKPSEFGKHYAWGETSPRPDDDYDYSQAKYEFMQNNSWINLGTTIDGLLDIQRSEHDAATVNMGKMWQLPTQADFRELINNCSWSQVTVNDVNCFKFVSNKYPNRYIIMPQAGYRSGTGIDNSNEGVYMSSNQYNDDQAYHIYLKNIDGPQAGSGNHNNKWKGHSVRAIARPDTIAGQVLRITTNKPTWTQNSPVATISGTLNTLLPIDGTMTVGFVIGDSTNIDFDHKRSYNEQAVSQTGDFTHTLDVYNNMGYWYRAYVKIGDEYLYGEPQHYGLEMVDMGLPSGTKWANMNVGANTPTEAGNYYAWGETSPKTNYTSNTYSYYQGGWVEIGSTKSDGTIDISESSNDAAWMLMGKMWHMPSKADFEELIANSTFEDLWIDDTPVTRITSKLTGKQLILPKKGYGNGTNISDMKTRGCYASATRYTNNMRNWFMENRSGTPVVSYAERYHGLTVRAVASPDTVATTTLKLTTDEAEWTYGSGKAMLHATLSTVAPLPSAGISVGFIVGDSETITWDNKSGYHEQTITSDGDFSQEVDVDNNIGKWFRPYAKIGNEYLYGKARHYAVEKVDLGLPDHTLWANMNVGANTPIETGDYFAWGNTTTSATYTETNNPTYNTSIGDNISGTSYDAARANWGGDWRMPTKTEIDNLITGCSFSRVLVNGQWCVKATSKAEGNNRYIYLPEAGYRNGTTLLEYSNAAFYWSSTPNNNTRAYRLYSNGTSQNSDYTYRYYGLTVRPVTSQ